MAKVLMPAASWNREQRASFLLINLRLEALKAAANRDDLPREDQWRAGRQEGRNLRDAEALRQGLTGNGKRTAPAHLMGVTRAVRPASPRRTRFAHSVVHRPWRLILNQWLTQGKLPWPARRSI